MSIPLHPRLRQFEPLVSELALAAEETLRAARDRSRASRRKLRGTTLAPGMQTPLWSELALACERHLIRYGAKAKLARFLGVSRQRLHLLLVAKTACADAERTLQLVAWLATQRRGRGRK